ncbi:MAG: 7TM receptor with intracellular metal dependent phosphohydrolase [Candidatus Berkelbacteria bacterium Licking1014_7]|uniref:7TM receptor with intracellular metal dependent phosphohydrolase n=1 Tax=Candidatus Berkelbacteria bacterium Licking1014_7 TaxID=2017147 RepID=A0A554LIE5_9BACT|nr:MAG: 7TM receptor with intracellular metal dependent phosphohydrolase [Candidatus Berkelbacteria bacterium Licking1014_7]
MHKKYRYLFILLVAVWLAIFCLSFLFNLIGRTFEFSSFWRLLMMALSGLISAIIITFIVIYTTPVLKEYLHTLRSLLRLDTLSHPLLLKLQQKAPASFHHSLMVANLAHRAGKAIGADPLLTRIGGYYHDIGKAINPEYYFENNSLQKELTKISDFKLKALKLSSHVKNGVLLAKQYHLPQGIIDLIIQSHGTSEISFLHKKAQELKIKINKKDLRYQGIKPQTKEAAILMLADGVESKIRSQKILTKQMIDEIINEIISSKLNDRQIELSGITQSELYKIKKALTEGVEIIHHQRLKYPNDQN